MTRPTLIVFTRAPRYGTGKRRLARRCGAGAAWRFQTRTLARLLRLCTRDHRWQTVLCHTPDRAARGPWCQGVPGFGQGRGDLGQRMGRALARFCGPVVLVGSDIPALRPAHIARAFALLRRADVVFGPAEDGGFWLVGLAHRRPCPALFQGVRWSHSQTLAECLAPLGRWRVSLTDRLADVD